MPKRTIEEVTCPGCRVQLRYDADLDGEPGICPACEHLVLPPSDDHESQAKNLKSLQAVLPIGDRLEDLEREGRSLARDHRIDLDEVLQTEFRKQKDAEEALTALKRDLREVVSAYQPSGKLPSSALGLMLLGTGAATVTAIIAEAIAGAICGLIIAALVALNVALAALGCIWCIAAVLGVIIGLIAYVAPFVVGGFAAAWATSEFGRLGKNRNMTAVALVSVVATVLANLVLWVLVGVFLPSWLDNQPRVAVGNTGLHLIIHGAMALGGLIGVATAWFMGRSFVQAAKFCEECEEFMDETKLKTLGVGPVRTMVKALWAKDMPVAASMQCCEKAPEGTVTLFACPSCQVGYVEVQIEFNGAYKDSNGDQANLTEVWLVCSKPLTATDVAWFRIFNDQGKEPDEVDEEIED